MWLQYLIYFGNLFDNGKVTFENDAKYVNTEKSVANKYKE